MPSLRDFRKGATRDWCPVCALPRKVIRQLHDAIGDIPMRTQAAWLQSEGYEITSQQIHQHLNGKHHQ